MWSRAPAEERTDDRCPWCDGPVGIVRSGIDGAVFECGACWSAWRIELGFVRPVRPQPVAGPSR